MQAGTSAGRHWSMGTSNGLNHFNVNALKSCGLNFSENTQGLREQGQRTLSPGGICLRFLFRVPVSVVIVAGTEACQKRFKMPTASLDALQSPLRVLSQAWSAEGEGLRINSTGYPTRPAPRGPLSEATDAPSTRLQRDGQSLPVGACSGWQWARSSLGHTGLWE